MAGALVIAALLMAGPLRAQEPANNGDNEDRITLPLALSWKYTAASTPYNASAPAVVGNIVYFTSGSRLYAVDADTGALQWRYPRDEPLATAIQTTPVVADERVFFGAADGKLYAIRAATGSYAWAFDTRSSIDTSPALADGILYFGSADGRLWAIDGRTGDSVPAWKGGVKTSDELSGVPAVAHGMVYALTVDQVLHAIDAATAQERYSVRLPGSVPRMSPVLAGDGVYVASGQNLICFLARNLKRKWTQSVPAGITASPAVNEQAAFVICADNHVYSFEARSGKPRWKTAPRLDYDVVARPVLSGDLLLIGALQGGLYAIDARTGAVRWRYKVEPSTRDVGAARTVGIGSYSQGGVMPAYAGIAAAPVVAGGALYVLSDDGSVSCFRADAVDDTPPIISNIEPRMGVVINGAPPIHFEAKITDEGSGVNPGSVRILLDGKAVPRRPEGEANEDRPGFRFDVLTSTLKYNTPAPLSAAAVRPLSDGLHTVAIIAGDWKGNTATRTWSFTVDNGLASGRSGRS
jgi:outer membrane protein assembly factor BamB